ncbi:peptidoglycan-binding protein LysM [Salegentibacter sp. F188]|uniref:Peptidoglycan-binding protein LysM n=1 Tax=Autumnicola patrickiae TaxID=3075591 RepID=A0ABU3E7B7_9FLAO|nr:peptidoglycan-binding protein LysM [Salegentibacter sp. F188]MDT0691878.1 peptidoglycan-binding protein LysM [Salegentibacter sp. F188]
MGIFSFIKEAGSKILGIGKSKSEKNLNVSEQRTKENQQENAKAASRLEENIRELNLGIDNLDITIEGDMATVSGEAEDQATREKIILVVGNTAGIAQVDDRMDVEDEEPEAIFHTVERGDTLSKIAEDHYGDPNRYKEIFEANRPMLKDPDKIYPGQVLRIPQPEERN